MDDDNGPGIQINKWSDSADFRAMSTCGSGQVKRTSGDLVEAIYDGGEEISGVIEPIWVMRSFPVLRLRLGAAPISRLPARDRAPRRARCTEYHLQKVHAVLEKVKVDVENLKGQVRRAVVKSDATRCTLAAANKANQGLKNSFFEPLRATKKPWRFR